MAGLQPPVTDSYLSQVGFRFTISNLPNFEYYVQKFDFPGFSLNTTKDLQTPFNKVIIPGDHLTWDDFNVTIVFDELMYSYFELADWIRGVGFPESFDQYAEFIANAQNNSVTVNADLLILDNTQNPIIKVTFEDVLPVGITGFTFDVKAEQVNPVTATATFKYRQWTYQRLQSDS